MIPSHGNLYILFHKNIIKSSEKKYLFVLSSLMMMWNLIRSILSANDVFSLTMLLSVCDNLRLFVIFLSFFCFLFIRDRKKSMWAQFSFKDDSHREKQKIIETEIKGAHLLIACVRITQRDAQHRTATSRLSHKGKEKKIIIMIIKQPYFFSFGRGKW